MKECKWQRVPAEMGERATGGKGRAERDRGQSEAIGYRKHKNTGRRR